MLCLYWFPHEAQLRWDIELFSLSRHRLPSLWLSVCLHPEGRLISTSLKETSLITDTWQAGAQGSRVFGVGACGLELLASVFPSWLCIRRTDESSSWTISHELGLNGEISVKALNRTVNRFGFGAAEVRDTKDKKAWGGENSSCHFLLISTWPQSMSRVHETHPAHLKIA